LPGAFVLLHSERCLEVRFCFAYSSVSIPFHPPFALYVNTPSSASRSK
jgi:hypothetical protein